VVLVIRADIASSLYPVLLENKIFPLESNTVVETFPVPIPPVPPGKVLF
jgi:hypothetical protein